MYGIFAYIWLMFIVNVGKYTSPTDPMAMLISFFSFLSDPGVGEKIFVILEILRF